MERILIFFALFLTATACGPRIISGTVTDRNGNPVERALVRIAPGEVELVTDSSGYFQVDYLRDKSGERVKLGARTDYVFEVFKPGYHLYGSDPVFYKRGEFLLEPITLKEDTIRVVGSDSNIDPEQYPDRTHSSGASYEGE
jgi:hypothetical protein